MFRRVFGSIWGKRISTQGSFFLGADAGGHCLGPHGGLLRLRQVVFGSYFIFLGSILEFLWHPGKVIFSWFLALLGFSKGFPGGPEMPILAAFLAFWVDFRASGSLEKAPTPAGLQTVLQKK